MDWMPQERERGITITAAATTLEWQNHEHPPHRHARPRRLHHRGRALAARARRRGGGVLRRLGRRAAVRDGVAPGRQVPGPAAGLHQQDGPRRRRLRRRGRGDPRRAWAREPVPIQLPIGAEDRFEGVVDLVRAEGAVLLGRRGRGRRARTTSPRRWPPRWRPRASKLIEAAADFDDAIADAFLEGQPIDEAAAQGGAAQGDDRLRHRAGAGGRGPAQQGRPAAARRGLRLPAVAARGAAGRRARSRATRRRPAARPTTRAPFCALAFKVAMDEGRKAVYLRIYSGVLKPGRRGAERAHAAQTRRWRGCSRCTPTGASGSSGRAPAASSSPWASRTRAPATRCAARRRRSCSSASTPTSR